MNSKSRLLVLLLLVASIGLVTWGAPYRCAHRLVAGHGLRASLDDHGEASDAIRSQLRSEIRSEIRSAIRSSIRSSLRSITAIARVGAPTVEAQEALDFKPVPAESLSEYERRRSRNSTRRTATSVTTPALPAIPDEPAVPEEPAIPVAPGKSGNITRLGSDIEIEADQVVVGDVVALGGDITVAGHVEGDVAAMGGDVFLKSTARVDGDVVCMGGRLNEEDGAKVGGQRVSGLGARGHRSLREHPEREVERRSHDASGSLVWLLIVLGLAWAFTRLGPGRTTAAVETLRREPGMSLGVGAMIFALIIPSIVALALVVAILCITIIGIPFALAALLAYVLFLCLMWLWGFVIAAIVIGEAVIGRLAKSSSDPLGGVSANPAKPAPSLTRRAVVGVLVLGGADVVGEILKIGPLHGIGVLISVLSFIAFIVALTIGSGAWLRTEIKAGTLARWWRGNQWGRNPPAAGAPGSSAPFAPAPYVPPAPAAPPPYSPPSPPPYVPPPPPSPPSSFAPPKDPGEPPAPVS